MSDERVPLKELPVNTQLATPKPKKPKNPNNSGFLTIVRPGPKPKAFSDRIIKRTTPLKKIERTYSRATQLEVLTFLWTHLIPCSKKSSRIREPQPLAPEGYRYPTYHEAEAWYKIPNRTITSWWLRQDIILTHPPRRRAACWPEVEALLFEEFIEARSRSFCVTQAWFRQQKKRIWNTLYPESTFAFSHGWFVGFCYRYSIVRRRVTKVATKAPDDIILAANNFVRFVRRLSQPKEREERDDADYRIFGDLIESSPISNRVSSRPTRFPRFMILNFDETPIPFEYLDGYTYSLKGLRTISGKTDRSGWNKRQATLILFIWADGKDSTAGKVRVRPILIFHGAPGDRSRITAAEKEQYAKGVNVIFNEKAYNNAELTVKIVEEIAEYTKQEDCLLVMDVAGFHLTDDVTDTIKNNNLTRCLIPAGLTSTLQPLDTAINGPLKRWLRELADEYIAKKEAEYAAEHNGDPMVWTTSDRRIMTTHIVEKAVERLFQRPEMIRRAFQQCGISILPDGSEDNLIKLKDIPSEAISFDGWEVAENQLKQEYEVIPDGHDNLNESFNHAMEDFLPRKINWSSFTVAKLKAFCIEKGLKPKRLKADLVEQLEDHEKKQQQNP